MMYQALDALLIRAAAVPLAGAGGDYPDLTGPVDAAAVSAWREWLHRVWQPDLAAAVELASPDLGAQVRRVQDRDVVDAAPVRRVIVAVLKYLLRATSRATPFGLFAGVAPARRAERAAADWIGAHTTAPLHAGRWLSGVVDELEARPALLADLLVVGNSLIAERDGRLVLSHQTGAGGELGEVSVRITEPVAAAVEHTRATIAVRDLVDKLSARWADTPRDVIETMVSGLVRQRVLVSELRPPMICTDPVGHVQRRVDAVPSATGDGGERRLATVVAQDRPVGVDLRLGLEVSIPAVVVEETTAAARALTLLTSYPSGAPAWTLWHEAFLDRYGPAALVPLAEVLDSAVGLGWPATFRGAAEIATDTRWTQRDQHLAALVHESALDGIGEIVLDESALSRVAERAQVTPPPHASITVQVHASTLAAVDRGAFAVEVTGGGRAVGTTEGRFLRLLDDATLGRFRNAYAGLPVLRSGAMPVQVSAPPLDASDAGLARAPRMLVAVLQVGEFPAADAAGSVGLEDLAVGGDEHGLYLLSLGRRQLLEPTVLNAIELRYHAHPLVRFLCEVTRARCAVYMPFTWGALATLPYLPRLRYGRAVLSPAHWNLSASALPRARESWARWRETLNSWRQRYRVPDAVYLAEADNRLRLELTAPAHLAVLRAHLDRHGRAHLREAPAATAFGWIGGHAHELVIPLVSTAAPLPSPDLGRAAVIRTSMRGDGHLPGASGWLCAHLYTDLSLRWQLLDDLADQLSTWEATAGWWFVPFTGDAPHLRVRVRLAEQAAFGALAEQLGRWAYQARGRGILGRLTFESYLPETGRYGHGAAMHAAEDVFIADSMAALAEHRLATQNGLPLDAISVASLLDLAAGYIGTTAAGMRWLIDRVPHAPVRVDADVRDAVRRLGLGEDAVRELTHGEALLNAWSERRARLATYGQQLSGQRDPSPALGSLLHMHHVRVHAATPEAERVALHLARSVALTWQATRERP